MAKVFPTPYKYCGVGIAGAVTHTAHILKKKNHHAIKQNTM